MQDHVITVTGGEVIRVKRKTQGSDIRWVITVRPDGNDDVTIVLPATTDCADDSAVCTEGGKIMFESAPVTVPAPAQEESRTQNTPAAGQPALSGTAQVGETLTVDTSGITDAAAAAAYFILALV